MRWLLALISERIVLYLSIHDQWLENYILKDIPLFQKLKSDEVSINKKLSVLLSWKINWTRNRTTLKLANSDGPLPKMLKPRKYYLLWKDDEFNFISGLVLSALHTTSVKTGENNLNVYSVQWRYV